MKKRFTTETRRHGAEKKMLREFRVASTPPGIPATPSKEIPRERGVVAPITPPPLSDFSYFKSGFANFMGSVLRIYEIRKTLFLSVSPCLRGKSFSSWLTPLFQEMPT
jgi:hypothetical protein